MALITLANLTDVGFSTGGAVITGSTSLSTAGIYYISHSGIANIGLPAPANIAFNNIIVVKDISGNASTFPINLVGSGGALIDGNAQYTIEIDYGAAWLSWNGTGWSVLA